MLKHIKRGLVSNPPLVFLHGFLGCKEDFIPMIDILQEHYFCIALDQGDSIEEILETLHDLQISNCSLVGYSMGGRIALALCARFRERFKPIIAMGAHPGLQTEEEREERRRIGNAWTKILLERSFAEFLTQWYAQPMFDRLRKNTPVFEAMLERRRMQNPQEIAKILEQYSLAKQPIYDLQNAHFLCGAEDKKFIDLYHHRNIAAHVLPDCGHALPLENPKKCAEVIHAIIPKRLEKSGIWQGGSSEFLFGASDHCREARRE